MAIIQQARTILMQFLHNLDEANWISRHVADRGLDLPNLSRLYGADGSASSLSLALGQMGLVRQSSDEAPAKYIL